MVQRMPQVQIIEPTIKPQEQKIRVCAYARVSSDSDDQLNSFSAQVEYFTRLIQSHSCLLYTSIGAHLMDHPLQLPLDDGNGGFQLMGYGGKEVHPLLFLFPFPLDVLLQLLIGRLQAVQSITQLLGHLVQAGGWLVYTSRCV